MNFAIASAQTWNITNAIGAHTVSAIFICGVFVFGLSGGLAGAQKNLDFFGAVVIAVVVGMSGGAFRDIFLGIAAKEIFDWRVVTAALAGGLIAFLAHVPLLRFHSSIQILDAVGLSLFSVIGADISLIHNAGPLASVILGLTTGIIGGIIRDVLLNEIPQVLKAGLYAIPSLLASSLVVIGFELKINSIFWYASAAVVCFVVRLAGIIFDINLPQAKNSNR